MGSPRKGWLADQRLGVARLPRAAYGRAWVMGSRASVGAARRRFAVVAALALAPLAAGCGDDRYEVTGSFQNASALVEGNLVTVGSDRVGEVTEIRLGPNGEANVTFTVDEDYAPLRRGTTATVRWASLSSVANRQVQLTIPPDELAGDEIPDGGALSSAETVTAVDVDQFFNLFDRRTTHDLRRVIQGLAAAYEGVGGKANRGYRYLNPVLYQSRRVFTELSADEQALERLLVDGSRFSGALADRAPDVSLLVGNLNRMMNAIGDRKLRLARAIALFPPFMRNANTLFVNLRAALDDLQPLVVAARPAAEELLPFLRELRATARGAVPTVRDLSAIVRRRGPTNDLIELQGLQPPLREAAIGSGSPECGPGPENPDDLLVAADDDFSQGSFGEALCSLENGHPNLVFFRAYAPELVGWFDGFSHSGYVDAIGGVGRVGSTFNTFSPMVSPLDELNVLPNLSDPDSPAEQFGSFANGYVRRCPGSAERPLGPGYPDEPAVPFTDGGHLTDGVPGDCDPALVQPGP